MPKATENKSLATSEAVLRGERRRSRRREKINPDILPILRNQTGSGVLRKIEPAVETPPADAITTTTPESLIMDFLCASRQQAFCDDCLKQRFDHIDRGHIVGAARAIGRATGFRQVTQPCAGCDRVRIGIKAR